MRVCLTLYLILMCVGANAAEEEACPPWDHEAVHTTGQAAWNESLWRFRYSTLAIEADERAKSFEAARPFASLAPDGILADPLGTAGQLLGQLPSGPCFAPPANPDLTCKSFRAEGRDGTEGRIGLACQQTIDGVEARGAYLNAGFDLAGRVREANFSILDADAIALSSTNWPDDDAARRLADSAFLEATGETESVRRQITAVRRFYDERGPMITLTHRECGVTEIRADTGEATYTCVYPPRLPAWQPKAPSERLTLVSPLPYGFVVSGFGQACSLSLLWGQSVLPEEGHTTVGSLHAVDERGNVTWTRALGAVDEVSAMLNGERVTVVTLDQSGVSEHRVSTLDVDACSGELLHRGASWAVPAGTVLTVPLAGRRFLQHWSAFDQSVLTTVLPSGEEQWRRLLEPGLAISSVSMASTGKIAVVVRRGAPRTDGGHELLAIENEGAIGALIPLDIMGASVAQLLGRLDDSVFLLMPVGGGEKAVFRVDTRSGQIRRETAVPQRSEFELTRRGTLLYRSDDALGLTVGEIAVNGDSLWSQLLDAGHEKYRFALPRETGAGRVLTVAIHVNWRRDFGQSVGVLATLDRALARAEGGVCRPFEGYLQRSLSPAGDTSISITRSPTFSLLTPGCPPDAQRMFQSSAWRMFDEIAGPAGLGWQQQPISVLLVESPQGIRFPRPRQEHETEDTRDFWLAQAQGELRFQAHPDDILELAQILREQVAPHLRRMSALRDAIYSTTGALVMVEYGADAPDVAGRLAAAERELGVIAQLVEGSDVASSGVAWSPREFERAMRTEPTLTVSEGMLLGFGREHLGEPVVAEPLKDLTLSDFLDSVARIRAAMLDESGGV